MIIEKTCYGECHETKNKNIVPGSFTNRIIVWMSKKYSRPLKEVQAPDSDTVSLTVWGAAEDEELLREMIDGFERQYGGQADFQITYQPQSESSCTNALMADLENGADVFAFADDQLNTLVAAGALDPVENAEAVRASNLPEAVLAASVNDTLYALPLTADNGYFLYYDRQYFSQEDIASLDRMLDIAAENGKKVSMDWSSGWYLYALFGNTADSRTE